MKIGQVAKEKQQEVNKRLKNKPSRNVGEKKKASPFLISKI